MALATQCPHCHTTFRVAHDQLKLRAGLVRCGSCKQIFNGIENLVRPEAQAQTQVEAPDSSPPPSPPIPEPVAAAAPEAPAPLPPIQPAPEPEAVVEETPPPAHSSDTASSQETEKDDPLLRMTLMDLAPASTESAPANEAAPADEVKHQDDSVEQAIDELQAKPWRSKPDPEQSDTDALDEADAADYAEPSFVRQGRRRQRLGRALHIFMAGASIALFAGLLLQSIYIFRNQIAAWFPATQPLLTQACAIIDCQVGLPMQIDSVSLESSELQALAADSNTFVLNVLLRNHGATAQAWPNIELTLNDADDKPIARRVFIPREYLPSQQERHKGLAAKSEQPFKIYFELAQLKASGYRVYLFYP